MTAEHYVSADTPAGGVMFVVVLVILCVGLAWLLWAERHK